METAKRVTGGVIIELVPYAGKPDVRDWFFEPGTETFLDPRAVYEEIGRGRFDGWWLATENGTPCAIIGTYDSPHRWINPFIVAPQMRGRGVATATLLAMIEHPEIPPELWARIDRENWASRRAFEKAGFVEEPEHSNHDTVFVSTSG